MPSRVGASTVRISAVRGSVTVRASQPTSFDYSVVKEHSLIRCLARVWGLTSPSSRGGLVVFFFGFVVDDARANVFHVSGEALIEFALDHRDEVSDFVGSGFLGERDEELEAWFFHTVLLFVGWRFVRWHERLEPSALYGATPRGCGGPPTS